MFQTSAPWHLPAFLKRAAALSEITVLAGLFWVAFLSATLLPGGSEAALAALLVAKQSSPALLIAVASIGNVLGSCVNWLLGRGLDSPFIRRWLKIDPASTARAASWYQLYGRWSLLLSWVPVIGDPLTVAAGALREPFWSFVALVAIAKTARYLVVAWATLQLA